MAKSGLRCELFVDQRFWFKLGIESASGVLSLPRCRVCMRIRFDVAVMGRSKAV